MGKKKPRPGEGAQRVEYGKCPNNTYSKPQPAKVNYGTLRNRLCGARRRLVERLNDDFEPDRRFPDTGWSRLLADIHIAIMAVDEVIAEGGP